MVFHELFRVLLYLCRRSVCNLFAQLVHQFVGLCSLYGHLLQVRSVALYVYAFSWRGEDGLLREVWEHYHERHLLLTLHLIRKASCLHLNGVYSAETSVRAVYIKLALIKVQEPSVYLEVTFVGST